MKTNAIHNGSFITVKSNQNLKLLRTLSKVKSFENANPLSLCGRMEHENGKLLNYLIVIIIIIIFDYNYNYCYYYI